MAYQAINLGTAPNDNTGDPARTAGQKINENFVELYTLGNPTTNTITANSIVNSAGTGAPNFTNGLTVGTKGTFAPTVGGSTTAGTATYSAQVGYYTKLDNIVFIEGYMTLTSSISGSAGNLALLSIPYPIRLGYINLHCNNLNGYTGGQLAASGSATGFTSSAIFRYQNASVLSIPAVTIIQNTTTVYFCGQYQTT